jgi:hypothetical protein
MGWGDELLAVGAGERSASFEIFSQEIDPAWIEAALQATGKATVRRRKLPAEYVVWIVIGMALLRDRSIREVVRHLDLVLPESCAPGHRCTITGSAIVQARDRLGAEPIRTLFERTAGAWSSDLANQDRWRGLAVYGVDGSTLRVPDTKDNDVTFGRPRNGRGGAGYPQLRLVALMALRSHLLAALVGGPCTASEPKLAESLWDRIPDHSLTVLDRGFLSYYLFHRIQTQGTDRHWLIRAKTDFKRSLVQRLGPDDDLVHLHVYRSLRLEHPEMRAPLLARAIRYTRPGFRPQTLLTSLLDPVAYPASEIISLYHERWELELGFDEIKTHTLEREETLRSRDPVRVMQELWGLALAYNLVRLRIAHTASNAGVPPRRISYRHALMLIRNFWITAWLTSPCVIPRRIETLLQELALLILPERRPRLFPRAVKVTTTAYATKRSTRA